MKTFPERTTLHEPVSALRWIFSAHFPLEIRMFYFIAASLADLFLTIILINSGHFFESNPVADYFLVRWGIAGMAVFKIVLMTIVCTISLVIARSQQQLARRLLTFSACVVFAVVTYSLTLYLSNGGLIAAGEYAVLLSQTP